MLYKIDTTGAFKILVNFDGASGAIPLSKLVVKGDKIYGTAGNGGLFNRGVVFSVRTDGTHYKLLHSFGGTDGWEPTGDIAIDASGNIYGTTDVGGAGFSVQNDGDGVLYEVEPDGTFLQLHDFTAAVDGKGPRGVVLDTAGNLYGNTLSGPGAVAGSVYKFSPATAALTTLVVFPYGGESTPYVSWAAPNGNVFGYLNSYPEQFGHLGQLFVLANSDSGYRYEVLHTFTGGSDGAYPVGMTLSGPHQIIGLTRNGALTKKPQGRGTIFSYDNNTFTTLFNIGGPAANGTNPNAAPFVTDTGVILGTTAIGGPTCSLMANGCGVTFQYTP